MQRTEFIETVRERADLAHDEAETVTVATLQTLDTRVTGAQPEDVAEGSSTNSRASSRSRPSRRPNSRSTSSSSGSRTRRTRGSWSTPRNTCGRCSRHSRAWSTSGRASAHSSPRSATGCSERGSTNPPLPRPLFSFTANVGFVSVTVETTFGAERGVPHERVPSRSSGSDSLSPYTVYLPAREGDGIQQGTRAVVIDEPGIDGRTTRVRSGSDYSCIARDR